jgi:translation initiation factor IF-1
VNGEFVLERSAIDDHLAEMMGTVVQQLPSGLYHVDVDGRRVTAHIGGGSARNFVRVLVGDRVVIELTPRDLTRGRIVRKL